MSTSLRPVTSVSPNPGPRLEILPSEPEKAQDVSTRQDCEFLTWDSPSDPGNPFNWALPKKWRVTLLACFLTFIVEISGTMMTSAAEQINQSFDISDDVFPHSYWPTLSWNLGSAAAPLLGLPLMENFGVRWSYLVREKTLWDGSRRDS